MAKCRFCTIRLRSPRFSPGVPDAPFTRFAPALNNFRHPCGQEERGGEFEGAEALGILARFISIDLWYKLPKHLGQWGGSDPHIPRLGYAHDTRIYL